LRAAVSDDPDDRQFAIQLLFETIWHQGTVWEATADTVPFLYRALEADETPEKQALAHLLATIADCQSGKNKHMQASRLAVAQQLDLLYPYLRDPEPEIRRSVAAAVGHYLAIVARLLPDLQDALFGETVGDALFAAEQAGSAGGETLYNGIRLPSSWPPKITKIPREPVTPPYLKSPPNVIPIDLGRQLLVDDFLIEKTNLRRTFHVPKEHTDNPLVRPDKDWEKKGRGGSAMVFSDGVWYDPKDRLFKMWYLGGYGTSTCHAVSRDGLKWEKPERDVKKGTNVVQAD
jgi:hypothetical protein